jgi:oligoendopeptidase F
VVRQIAFYRFETLLHDERRKGEMSSERIAELWMQVQVESLGPAFEFTPDYGCYWAYIPHFVHSPFYVYAYAFGDCLVNALYGVYRDGAVPGFEAKYLAMLRAGGTKRHKELLAPFGLNAAEPAFWAKGLEVISGFIDELARVPRDDGLARVPRDDGLARVSRDDGLARVSRDDGLARVPRDDRPGSAGG